LSNKIRPSVHSQRRTNLSPTQISTSTSAPSSTRRHTERESVRDDVPKGTTEPKLASSPTGEEAGSPVEVRSPPMRRRGVTSPGRSTKSRRGSKKESSPHPGSLWGGAMLTPTRQGRNEELTRENPDRAGRAADVLRVPAAGTGENPRRGPFGIRSETRTVQKGSRRGVQSRARGLTRPTRAVAKPRPAVWLLETLGCMTDFSLKTSGGHDKGDPHRSVSAGSLASEPLPSS